MKPIFILSIVIAGVLSQTYDINPLDYTFDNLITENNRIGSGVAAKKGENLDYCVLTSTFIQKTQVCGCAIVDAKWVLTSARCVVE
jgi:secreted trypsin-like serine protease